MTDDVARLKKLISTAQAQLDEAAGILEGLQDGGRLVDRVKAEQSRRGLSLAEMGAECTPAIAKQNMHQYLSGAAFGPEVRTRLQDWLRKSKRRKI